MIYRTIIEGAIVSLWVLSLRSWAVEYRLQGTHLDCLIFSSYVDGSTESSSGQATMQRLEARLDSMAFPPSAMLPGREL